MAKLYCSILAAGLLAGCVNVDSSNPWYWTKASGFGHPSGEQMQACDQEAAKVGGRDSLDIAMRRAAAFEHCMRTLGYLPAQ